MKNLLLLLFVFSISSQGLENAAFAQPTLYLTYIHNIPSNGGGRFLYVVKLDDITHNEVRATIGFNRIDIEINDQHFEFTNIDPSREGNFQIYDGDADLDSTIEIFGATTSLNVDVFGGAGDDVIRNFTGHRTYLAGEGGNDEIQGGFGEDVIVGGSGDDLLMGGSGNDELYGGWGTDMIQGQAGNDILQGNARRWIYQMDGRQDFLFGGPGSDVLYSRMYRWQHNPGWFSTKQFLEVEFEGDYLPGIDQRRDVLLSPFQNHNLIDGVCN